MEQDSNPVQPALNNNYLLKLRRQPMTLLLLLLRPRIPLQAPIFVPQAPSGPESTPMDEPKSLKRPHVSDSDSDTAKQKQQPRQPQLHPKPNTSNPRNKENATSTKT